MSMHQIVGNTVIREESGNFVVQNIGNGVALNVRYRFTALDLVSSQRGDEPSYVLNVQSGQKVQMPEPVAAYCGSYDLIFQFESIEGKTYESVVTFSRQVLTNFEFRQIEVSR